MECPAQKRRAFLLWFGPQPFACRRSTSDLATPHVAMQQWGENTPEMLGFLCALDVTKQLQLNVFEPRLKLALLAAGGSGLGAPDPRMSDNAHRR